MHYLIANAEVSSVRRSKDITYQADRLAKRAMYMLTNAISTYRTSAFLEQSRCASFGNSNTPNAHVQNKHFHWLVANQNHYNI